MKKIFCIALACLLIVMPTFARKPLIGISTSFGSGRSSAYLRYSEVIADAGGVPVLIPLAKSEAIAEETIRKVDGVMFIGGEDFNPAYFGESVLNETVDINGPRDTSDIWLMEAALHSKKSILGICRGVQLMNICLGGSLYQDLPVQYDGVLPHSDTTHLTMIEPGSRIGKILLSAGAETGEDIFIKIKVNSFHHQSIKDVAPTLTVTAKAPDGVVEAVEMPGRRFVVGTQFHPEIPASKGDPLWQALFKAFVKSCR